MLEPGNQPLVRNVVLREALLIKITLIRTDSRKYLVWNLKNSTLSKNS